MLHAAGLPEVTALALISVGAGALGVLALWALFRRLDEGDTPVHWSIAAVGVAMTTPLYWFTAARPLSDTSGLAAALAVQAMTLGAADSRGLALAAFCAGLAAGLRSQVVWLTVPLLALRASEGLGIGDRGLEGQRARGEAPIPSPQSLIPIAAAFAAGIALWFVPLVVVSGGPTAYWHALFDQGAEDLGNIQMLWTRHGARDVSDALYYAFVAPWAAWPVAAVALAAACAGLARLATRQRRTLVMLAVAFLPYLIFDLLFQESFTSRYALPLVVPMAYLAVAGLRLLPWDIGLAVAVAARDVLARTSAARRSPPTRARRRRRSGCSTTMRAAPRLDGAVAGARAGSSPVARFPAAAQVDRRRRSAIRNPQSAIRRILGAPPQHEWLEAVKYWNGGGRAPVWFVVDPARAGIDLVQHGDPVRYRWPLPYPVLLSGVRPNEMDWYRVDRPEWYVGEGWALTPEAAGVADADRRDPSHGPITGWIHGPASSRRHADDRRPELRPDAAAAADGHDRRPSDGSTTC